MPCSSLITTSIQKILLAVATGRPAADDAPVLPEVEVLPPVERGFVLGLALAGAAPAAAARLAGPGGERCARALGALAAAAPDTRAGELEELRREALAPVPAGIERVHPGWIRRALADEPADV